MEAKIKKARGQEPDDFELSVANELYQIEMSSSDLKPELRDLYILSAKDMDVGAGRRAVVIFVPYRLLRRFNKIQKRLVNELEKKFTGKHVLIIGQRTILGKAYARSTKTRGPRPRSRTLSAVHDAILQDIVYPTDILGKRTRCRVDGSKTMKVFLDHKDLTSVEGKVDTFAQVYKKLTNKDVAFEFLEEA
uniref:40S ribosomal protein S7 n=1 Tax=Pinguiococcus pyrenoidosus TaxID=172671 RepID=A0A7R9UD79_9STRA|eukprot:scaffold7382_cov284-Pinguiococcus_pyrenoidosus.AAC.4